jgi:hypothetical protein
MTAAVLVRPVTSAATFSYYLTPTVDAIAACAPHADALTLRGPNGPDVIRKLRLDGFDTPVLFDREGWASEDRIPVGPWIEQQQLAGADRTLTPGSYIRWNTEDPERSLALVAAEVDLAQRWESTAVLAVDARWVANDPGKIAAASQSDSVPVAIVLVDPGDPFARNGAVDGIRVLSGAISDLTFLRSDHSALGAIAFGAKHAAIGLRSSHRHGTTPDRKGFARRGDFSPRIFSYTFADWFTAVTIAGWSLADPKLNLCHLPCCRGQDLARFHDEDNHPHAQAHNILAVKLLADLILDAPRDLRRKIFLDYCTAATENYENGGFRGPHKPKSQLTNWVLA